MPSTVLYCIILVILRENVLRSAADCGTPMEEDVPRIVGGRDVGFYKFPWFAILERINIDYALTCGASLISPSIVLTAAHCYKQFLPLDGKTKLEEIYQVSIGVYNKCSKEDHRTSFNISEVVLHENYWEKKPFYDIAILKLAGSTTTHVPICLPTGSGFHLNAVKHGIAIGLGKTDPNSISGKLPCTLMQAVLEIYPSNTCEANIKKMDNSIKDPIDVMCAGYLEGGIDTCQGDSGGPFQVQMPNGRYYLIGITSFGYGCAQPDYLGIYTNVSSYLDWIYARLGTPADLQSTATMASTIQTNSPEASVAIEQELSSTLTNMAETVTTQSTADEVTEEVTRRPGRYSWFSIINRWRRRFGRRRQYRN